MSLPASPPAAFYVTGTDTGIGKTFSSCALLHALRQRGHRAVGMKPVASGCERTPAGLRNDDATALLARIEAAFARLQAQADTVVVEGVGGWLAPLSTTLDQSHLVHALQLPVVMVVGLRLGCLNHARLTAQAIAASGATCIGWIANEVDPQMERIDDNVALLRARLPLPFWGRLPYAPGADPAQLARHLLG
jgi:dethiobiotin synthetase